MKKNISFTQLNKIYTNINNNNILHTTFENINILSKGGFGIVYKCKHILDMNWYAIKKISFLINKNNPGDLICKNINNKLKEVR